MSKPRRLNRERVLYQAAEMANAAGDLGAVSLTALAQALDIRPPSLYNHIAGLDDLHYGLAVLALQRQLEAFRTASAGLTGRAALSALAHAYRQFAHQQPGIYPLTIRAAQPQQTELTAVAQELLQMFLLVMASMGIEGEDALHAIRGMRAIAHGFAQIEVAEGYQMPLDRDESFRRLVATFLDGLGK